MPCTSCTPGKMMIGWMKSRFQSHIGYRSLNLQRKSKFLDSKLGMLGCLYLYLGYVFQQCKIRMKRRQGRYRWDMVSMCLG
jgi:hypothetical protein